jgi:membrane protein DedA with SNARE-associated domain
VADTILDAVSGVGGPLLYLITFLLAFAETAAFLDFFIPGEVGLVVAGAAAQRAGEPLAVMIAAGARAAPPGDTVSYLLGRRFGVRIVERWDFTRRHLGPKIERAQDYFGDKGGAAVFFGRFVGALRAVVPLVAGTAGMPFRRFFLWNVAASICWAGAVLSLGYFVGERIADVIDRLGLWISVVALALVAAYFGFRWWRRRRVSASASDDRPASPRPR